MITVRCLVENTSLPGTEFRAEHGMAWHVETPHGQVLFDTGLSGDVLLHNAALLGVDFTQIDALVLSHAHYDHTGGLRAALARVRPNLPLYASPDLFRPRYKTTDSGEEYVGIRFTRDELAAQVDLRLSADPVEIIPGVWATGDITGRYTFTGGGANLIVPDGDGWQPDQYLDDYSLVLHTSAGLVVLLGCGHAGLLNILGHIKRHFEGPVHVVAGGTHLISATDAMLAQAVDELDARYDAPQVYPCHCTGQRAFDTLHAALGDRVAACPAGTVFTFPEA